MTTTPKYKAKAVFWDTEKETVIGKSEVERYRVQNRLKLPDNIARFDSQHEFKVYLELCRMYGADRVIRQFPVKIFLKSDCYPRGKTWKVDFAIKSAGQLATIANYVEAKGAFLPEFATTLAVLEWSEPDVFSNLVIVFSGSLPLENRMVCSLLNSNSDCRLLTLKELQRLFYLPSPL
ncbi:MAG: hypothetical protein ACRDBG_00750 [Waterburya sp.]